MWTLRHRLQIVELAKSRANAFQNKPCIVKLPTINSSRLYIRCQRLSQKAQLIETLKQSSETNKKVKRQINDVRHYLKSSDVPETIRRKIIREKLSCLIELTSDPTNIAEVIPTINQVLLQMNVKKEEYTDLISRSDLTLLFNRTAAYVNTLSQPKYPQFMALIALSFLKGTDPVTSDVLINIVEMGSLLRLGDFRSTLSFILSYRASSLPVNFASDLLERMWERNLLDLEKFEVLVGLDLLSKEVSLVNDLVVLKFIDYVEYLFANENPDMHQFKDLEKNIYRVLFVVNQIVECSIKSMSTESLLKIMKLKVILNSIASSEGDKKTVTLILDELKLRGQSNDFLELKEDLFEQDLFDESLCESVLLESASYGDEYRKMCSALSEFIVLDSIKFSSSLRYRAALLRSLNTSHSLTTDEIKRIIHQEARKYSEEGDELFPVLVDSAQALTKIETVPHPIIYEYLMKDLAEEYSPGGIELYFYKHFIDFACQINDPSFGLNVFLDSVHKSASAWYECTDPSAAATLNILILKVVDDASDITKIFPVFRNIRLHLAGSLSAETMASLVKPMLADNCVGDVIEMMKRELPKMNKNSHLKLNVNSPWSYAHKSLFDNVLHYVVTYKGDSTYETNWQLYGELHKYFQIPFESYFPVLRFFCEADRLNAALVIFRTLKLLNELHGENNANIAPLREIYKYLLQVFGDKLYEEGVHELHECMKMDVVLEDQDIELQNCLLNAYTNLQDIGKARDTFLSISANPKKGGGVNEETIQIMIKAYTYSDLSYVTRFWNNLSTYGIYPNDAIFRQYIIAHVYHGLVDKAAELISSIDDYNLVVSQDLLLAMYNYCLEPSKQREVEKWLIENHNDEWEKMRASGLLRSATEHMPQTSLLIEGKK